MVDARPFKRCIAVDVEVGQSKRSIVQDAATVVWICNQAVPDRHVLNRGGLAGLNVEDSTGLISIDGEVSRQTWAINGQVSGNRQLTQGKRDRLRSREHARRIKRDDRAGTGRCYCLAQ